MSANHPMHLACSRCESALAENTLNVNIRLSSSNPPSLDLLAKEHNVSLNAMARRTKSFRDSLKHIRNNNTSSSNGRQLTRVLAPEKRKIIQQDMLYREK